MVQIIYITLRGTNLYIHILHSQECFIQIRKHSPNLRTKEKNKIIICNEMEQFDISCFDLQSGDKRILL